MFRKIIFTLFLSLFGLIPFSCEELESLGLTETEIIGGLKEALSIGANTAGSKLSVTDGYFADQAVKILLPPEAKPILDNISLIPGGQTLVNEVVLKLNRGAEKAATKAAPIFLDAITGMTVTDGLSILKGSDTAATSYLKSKTTTQLTNAFAPEINAAMDEVGAATVWNTLFSNYNQYANSFAGQLLGLQPVTTDLGTYATEKALKGLFLKVADQEILIRKDPVQRTSELLKKVFKEQD